MLTGKFTPKCWCGGRYVDMPRYVLPPSNLVTYTTSCAATHQTAKLDGSFYSNPFIYHKIENIVKMRLLTSHYSLFTLTQGVIGREIQNTCRPKNSKRHITFSHSEWNSIILVIETDGIECCRENGVPEHCFGYCLKGTKETKSNNNHEPTSVFGEISAGRMLRFKVFDWR